jgi:hypothetical protein
MCLARPTAVLGAGAVTAVLAAGACARASSAPAPTGDFPAQSAITESDLRRDLFALSGDEMRGREAGTLDELRASAWLADRAREAGLAPAGDDGTYFQFWPLRRTRMAASSQITIAGAPAALGRDVALLAPVDTVIDAPIVFVGEGRERDVAGVDLTGKVVAAVLSAPSALPAPTVRLRGFRYTLAALRERSAFLAGRGAAAVVLVSDSIAESEFDFVGTVLSRGRYDVDSAGGDRVPPGPPVLWLRRAALGRVSGSGAAGGAPGPRLVARLRVESFVYPSVNVVAKVPGRDTALRGEYVLFSGHQDHDGVRYSAAGDSIWNGADDNATVSVALLAIGRAFARSPGRRSALFVWHGAEERGLLGSRWYVAHPTVPREAIAAVLNGDMLGRNHPDSAALLGVQPPHRNSPALVAAAYAANERTARFAIDTTWDRVSHPEGWYFRSDHLPYARAGIPSIFFTTLLHEDYHTPRDEPSRIDVAKLARVARWMYATGWMVANAAQRPTVEPGFKLER